MIWLKRAARLASVALVLAAQVPSRGAANDAGAPLPSLAEIRARLVATAAMPSSYRLTKTILSSDGSATTVQVVHRGDDERTTRDVGPLRVESGVYHGTHWIEDQNGQIVRVRTDAVDEARSDQATFTTVRDPDGDGHHLVISTVTAHKVGRRETVDTATWRVERVETFSVDGTIVRTEDDVRASDGVSFPHHIHTVNPIEKSTSDERVTAFTAGPVTDEEVAPPPSGPPVVHFPPGRNVVRIPFRYVEGELIVRVTVAGRGLDFALDTGAGAIAIDETPAAQPGLPDLHAPTSWRQRTERVRVPQLDVGDLSLRNVVIMSGPLGMHIEKRTRVAGLLGFDFLDELGVTVDYNRQELIVVPAADYVPPNDAATRVLPVRLGSYLPLIDASFNGVNGSRFVLDTGCAFPFMIFNNFAYNHSAAMYGTEALAQDEVTVGYAGRADEHSMYAHAIGVAGLVAPGVDGIRDDGTQGFGHPLDGLIGDPLWSAFTLGLDWQHGNVYLTPAHRGVFESAP